MDTAMYHTARSFIRFSILRSAFIRSVFLININANVNTEENKIPVLCE